MELQEIRLRTIKDLLHRAQKQSKLLEQLGEELYLQAGLVDAPPKVLMNSSIILSFVQKECNVDVLKKTRARDVMFARELIIYLLKKYTYLPLIKIAEYSGVGDHTTALHHIKKVKNFIEVDDNYRRRVDEIDERLKLYNEIYEQDNSLQGIQ